MPTLPNTNELHTNRKRNIIIVFLIILLLSATAILYYFYGGIKEAKIAILGGDRIVKEVITVPSTTSARGSDGRFVQETGEAVPLVSKDKVIVEGGNTIKESYELALPVVKALAEDAKLVYIKSLGTVAVDGKSSGWAVVFGSKAKKNGYEIVVTKGSIIEQKEIISPSAGFDLPKDWYDGVEAIKSVQDLPQFKDTTITGMSFYYNEDGKRWGYALSSSNGTVSIPVR